MQRNDLLVWMDLEMTSLIDAQVDRIVEIAVVLTDQDLNVVAEGPELIIHADAALFMRDEGAFTLHEKNGIMPLVAASTISLNDAEDRVLAFLEEWVAPGTAPLCGNSIYMDRHFLRIQMPRIDQHLFYRCIDVSTIKELARRWMPAVYEEAKARKGESAHRAKDDILASIEELKFYRGKLFVR